MSRQACLDTKPPSQDAFDEVEDGPRVAAGEQHSKPGNDHRDDRSDAQEEEHDVVGGSEQPLHQRQPAVEILFDVGVVDDQLDRLLFIGGGVHVGHQSEIRAHPGCETSELDVEVEPPPRVLLSEHDHQQHGRSQHPGTSGTESESVLSEPEAGCGAVEEGQDDPDGDEVDETQARRQAVQVAVGVLDCQSRRVGVVVLSGHSQVLS